MRAIEVNLPELPGGTLAKDQPEYTPLPFAIYRNGRYRTDATLTRFRLEPEEVKHVAQGVIARELLFIVGALSAGLPELRDVPVNRILDLLGKIAGERGISLEVPYTEGERVDLWLHTLRFGTAFQPVTIELHTEEETRARIRSLASDG